MTGAVLKIKLGMGLNQGRCAARSCTLKVSQTDPHFFDAAELTHESKLSQLSDSLAEMAKTKQQGRILQPFPRLVPQPPRHSSGALSARQRSYALAESHWTISTRWDILVRKPGETQWYILQQYDPEYAVFKSMGKEYKKRNSWTLMGSYSIHCYSKTRVRKQIRLRQVVTSRQIKNQPASEVSHHSRN
jgi:hypothetical protein